jgi:hypothetical protein
MTWVQYFTTKFPLNSIPTQPNRPKCQQVCKNKHDIQVQFDIQWRRTMTKCTNINLECWFVSIVADSYICLKHRKADSLGILKYVRYFYYWLEIATDLNTSYFSKFKENADFGLRVLNRQDKFSSLQPCAFQSKKWEENASYLRSETKSPTCFFKDYIRRQKKTGRQNWTTRATHQHFSLFRYNFFFFFFFG